MLESLCGVLTGVDFCSRCSALVAHWSNSHHGDSVQSSGCQVFQYCHVVCGLGLVHVSRFMAYDETVLAQVHALRPTPTYSNGISALLFCKNGSRWIGICNNDKHERSRSWMKALWKTSKIESISKTCCIFVNAKRAHRQWVVSLSGENSPLHTDFSHFCVVHAIKCTILHCGNM